jgi:hypothetical protein
MYGSLLLARLMDDYPLLIPAGAAVLASQGVSVLLGAGWRLALAAAAPAALDPG